ncbi:MAG: hypothetical protein ACXAAH_08285 [Promethearchaeota archaeon]
MDTNKGICYIPKLSEEEVSESLNKDFSDEELDDIINGLQILSVLVFEVLSNTKN